MAVSVRCGRGLDSPNLRKRIGKWPPISHVVEDIYDLMYVSNQIRNQGSRISPGHPFNSKRTVASLETPNVGDENPPCFLASPDDDGDVTESRLLFSFHNPYRGPSSIETNRQSWEWKPGAWRRRLRCRVRFYRGDEWSVYQNLIEVVSQKQRRRLGGKHAVTHVW